MFKKRFFIRLCVVALTTTAIAVQFVSCTDKENVFDVNEVKEKMQPFSFKTSEKTMLSIDFGSQAAEEVVDIYPTEVDLITAKMHTDMLYSGFTDKNGTLRTSVELPSALTKVWIVSPTKPSLGVMTAEVSNGQLVLNGTRATRGMRRDAGTTTVDGDGNITTVQEDGTSLTLFDIDRYVTVHEGTISDEDKARGYKTLSTVSKSAMGHFYCIDRWMPTTAVVNGQYELDYHYGKTGNENGLKSVHKVIKDNAIEMAREQMNWVNANSGSFKQLQAEDINQVMEGETTVVENADGSTTTTTYDGSELWITFVSESAAYQNTFGYYIYKNGEEPTTVAAGDSLERIVLFPSASVNEAINLSTLVVGSGNPHSAGSRQTMTNTSALKTIFKEDAPLRAGDRVQLLFKDPETGAVSKRFPKGYTVGFWFCADAYDPAWYLKGSTPYGIDMREESAGGYKSKLVFTQANSRYLPWRGNSGNTYFCNTNPKATNSSLFTSSIKTRYVKHTQKLYGEQLTVYSVEDGTDGKYNDILFALERKDYSSVKHSNSDVKLHQEDYHTISTYAFEDKWPDGYDFDMNDVIVEHEQSQTYTVENKIYTVSDKFKLVSTLDAASDHNAFYVQFPEGEEGVVSNLKVTVNGKEMPNRWEAATNSVIVFTDQREALQRGETEVVVTRDLSNANIAVASLTYRPYLVAQAIAADGTTNIGQGRTEIHIPGDPITSLGKKLTVEDGAININYYASQFVSEDNKFPFALSLSGVADWKAPEPGVRIDKTFKNYKAWRDANGFSHMDWYYNKKGNDYRYGNNYYDPTATPWK